MTAGLDIGYAAVLSAATPAAAAGPRGVVLTSSPPGSGMIFVNNSQGFHVTVIDAAAADAFLNR